MLIASFLKETNEHFFQIVEKGRLSIEMHPKIKTQIEFVSFLGWEKQFST